MEKFPAAVVVATHPQQCKTLVSILETLGVKPALAFSVAELRDFIRATDPALVCCAPELPDGTYRDVLHEVATFRPGLPVVLLSRAGNCSEYLEAMNLGVFDCLGFPFARAEVQRIVCNALAGWPSKKAVAASG